MSVFVTISTIESDTRCKSNNFRFVVDSVRNTSHSNGKVDSPTNQHSLWKKKEKSSKNQTIVSNNISEVFLSRGKREVFAICFLDGIYTYRISDIYTNQYVIGLEGRRFTSIVVIAHSNWIYNLNSGFWSHDSRIENGNDDFDR